jgi:tetratricopeptide (TPR) repeat protein
MKFHYLQKIVFSALLLGIAGCGSKSLEDSSAPWPRSLLLMSQIWEGIKGDQDAKDVAACELAYCFSRNGYPKTTLEYLQGTDSHRGLVGMAKLTLAKTHEGQKDVARLYLAEAQKGSNRYLLSRPRELCIRMAQAYTALGQQAMANEWSSRLSDSQDLAEVKGLIQAEELRQGKISLEQVDAWTEPEFVEVIVAQMRAGKASEIQVSGWIKDAEKRVDGMYPVDRIQGYLLLASAARELGRVEDCERMMMKAEGISLEISPRIEAGTLARISVADAYVDAGNLEKAQVWIRKAQDSLPQNPYMAQPKAYAELAEVVWSMGKKEQAELLWTEALNRARTHLHPRARQLGVMAVLMSLLNSKVELTPEQEKMVLSVKNEELQGLPLATNPVEGYLEEAVVAVSDQEGKAKKKPTKAEGMKKTTLQSGSSKNKKSATQKKAP